MKKPVKQNPKPQSSRTSSEASPSLDEMRKKLDDETRKIMADMRETIGMPKQESPVKRLLRDIVGKSSNVREIKVPKGAAGEGLTINGRKLSAEVVEYVVQIAAEQAADIFSTLAEKGKWPTELRCTIGFENPPPLDAAAKSVSDEEQQNALAAKLEKTAAIARAGKFGKEMIDALTELNAALEAFEVAPMDDDCNCPLCRARRAATASLAAEGTDQTCNCPRCQLSRAENPSKIMELLEQAMRK